MRFVLHWGVPVKCVTSEIGHACEGFKVDLSVDGGSHWSEIGSSTTTDITIRDSHTVTHGHTIITQAPTQAPTPENKILRVSNRGVCTWTPAVKTLKMFKDVKCTEEIDLSDSNWQCSGISTRKSASGDPVACSNALDGLSTTSWRPQCHLCNAGEAWMRFVLPWGVPVKCVTSEIGEFCQGFKVDLSVDWGSHWSQIGSSTTTGIKVTGNHTITYGHTIIQ
jgi:hypothetical protein